MASLAGNFLVARPAMQDTNFAQTVVLIIQHDDDGAFGLVVNQQAEAEGLPFPLFTGGPCPSPGLVMVHGHQDWTPGNEPVAPGIYLGDADCMNRVKEAVEGSTFRFRIFIGYSGWGPDQLECEMTAHAWHVVPATGELLFDTPLDQLWERLNPTALPRPSMN